MPKILLGARAERAENTGGRSRWLAERQAEAAQDALALAQARVERMRTLAIPMPTTGLRTGRAVLTMDQAGWATPEGRTIVGPVDLLLVGPERVAITGPNGAGKTTLLRLITGARVQLGDVVNGKTVKRLNPALGVSIAEIE